MKASIQNVVVASAGLTVPLLLTGCGEDECPSGETPEQHEFRCSNATTRDDCHDKDNCTWNDDNSFKAGCYPVPAADIHAWAASLDPLSEPLTETGKSLCDQYGAVAVQRCQSRCASHYASYSLWLDVLEGENSNVQEVTRSRNMNYQVQWSELKDILAQQSSTEYIPVLFFSPTDDTFTMDTTDSSDFAPATMNPNSLCQGRIYKDDFSFEDDVLDTVTLIMVGDARISANTNCTVSGEVTLSKSQFEQNKVYFKDAAVTCQSDRNCGLDFTNDTCMEIDNYCQQDAFQVAVTGDDGVQTLPSCDSDLVIDNQRVDLVSNIKVLSNDAKCMRSDSNPNQCVLNPALNFENCNTMLHHYDFHKTYDENNKQCTESGRYPNNLNIGREGLNNMVEEWVLQDFNGKQGETLRTSPNSFGNLNCRAQVDEHDYPTHPECAFNADFTCDETMKDDDENDVCLYQNDKVCVYREQQDGTCEADVSDESSDDDDGADDSSDE